MGYQFIRRFRKYNGDSMLDGQEERPAELLRCNIKCEQEPTLITISPSKVTMFFDGCKDLRTYLRPLKNLGGVRTKRSFEVHKLVPITIILACALLICHNLISTQSHTNSSVLTNYAPKLPSSFTKLHKIKNLIKKRCWVCLYKLAS